MTKWFVGIIPGAIAAIVAAIISLPLESPDDAVLNSGTVTIGALIAGLAIGAAWTAFSSKPLLYAGAVIAAFVAVFVVAVLFASQLDGVYGYVIPLGIIVVAICGLLTPFVGQLLAEPRLEIGGSLVGLVAALGLGMALSGQGDNEAKRLSFPEARNTPVATSAATTAPGETPSSGDGVVTADDVAGVTYVVVPGDSTVQYTVTEKLASLPAESEAQGTTSTVSGEVHLDGQQSTFTFDASTFTSDQDRRDNYIRDTIFTPDPMVTFVVDDLTGLPESYTTGETVPVTVTGTATIRGVSQPLTFEVQGKFDGDELQLLGNTSFTWADFNIEPPNTPLVTVTDEVRIEVLIIARSA